MSITPLQCPCAGIAQARSDLQAVNRHEPAASVEVCQQIAAARAAEGRRSDGPLFIDPYADVMAGPVRAGVGPEAALQTSMCQVASAGAPNCLAGCLLLQTPLHSRPLCQSRSFTTSLSGQPLSYPSTIACAALPIVTGPEPQQASVFRVRMSPACNRCTCKACRTPKPHTRAQCLTPSRP